MNTRINDAHAFIVSVARLGRGWRVLSRGTRQPSQTLELYEFEACPYCRKVREVLSELDLNYLCRPCARGSNNRLVVKRLGGKRLFPFLVDPNTGRSLYESELIIDYLRETYGPGKRRLGQLFARLNTAGAFVASAIRPRGRVADPSSCERDQPEKLLQLYNFEASPYCRKVRETLNELNLDHVVRNVAKGSTRRPELVSRGGRMMVPYLVDPNHGIELYESEEIVAYLNRTYGGA